MSRVLFSMDQKAEGIHKKFAKVPTECKIKVTITGYGDVVTNDNGTYQLQVKSVLKNGEKFNFRVNMANSKGDAACGRITAQNIAEQLNMNLTEAMAEESYMTIFNMFTGHEIYVGGEPVVNQMTGIPTSRTTVVPKLLKNYKEVDHVEF